MASDTGGVKAFSLEGRLYRERERLTGMTAEERAWRAQFIKDQHLSKCEPRVVPELYKELNNPFRRLYTKPLNALGTALIPILGIEKASAIRVITGKAFIAIALIYAGAYYCKYNTNDWTRKGGWRAISNRPSVLPGEPLIPDRTSPSEYANRGFTNSPI